MNFTEQNERVDVLTGAEGGTSLPFFATRVNTHESENTENLRSIQSRQMLPLMNSVDRKRTHLGQRSA